MVAEYILLGVLLLAAIFIIVGVTLQKSSKDGLSGTIVGGTETYYGKDKTAHTDHILFKWTKIAAIVFVAATLIAYIIQPDFATSPSLDGWKDLTNFGGIFQ